MTTTREFLAAVKARHGIPTDYRLAKYLGISRQRVSNNMAGETMSDDTGLKVAAALDLEPGYVLACIAAERAKSETVKAAWQKIAAAAAVVLVALALAPVLETDAIMSAAFLPAGDAAGTLYIM